VRGVGQAPRGSNSLVPVARSPMAGGLLVDGRVDITTLRSMCSMLQTLPAVT
jgi:hypothetical protein